MAGFLGSFLTYGVKFVFELAVIVCACIAGAKFRMKKDAENKDTVQSLAHERRGCQRHLLSHV